MKALTKFSKISENVSINILKQNYGFLKKENKIKFNSFAFSAKYQQEERILKNTNNIKNKVNYNLNNLPISSRKKYLW